MDQITAHLRHHLKHMLIGGLLIFAALWATGMDLGRAFGLALVLACHVGMAVMMVMMMRGRGHADGGHDHRPQPPAVSGAGETLVEARESARRSRRPPSRGAGV